MSRAMQTMWPTASRYAVAAAATAAAFFVRLGLDPWLGAASPLLTFVLAVLVAAVWGGVGPGLFATALSIAAGSYFLGRNESGGLTSEILQIVVFALVGGGVSFLCARLHSARHRAERDRARLEREAGERREAEAALQAQADLLRTTLTSAGDAMIATDTAGNVTFLNPVAEALTGWTHDEAVGVPLKTVFRIMNEETRAAVDNPALRALAEGRVIGLANHTVLISRDGTERPIDDSAAPIRSGDGTVRGAVLVFRDISDRKAAEQKLRESERRYRTVLESVTDAFIAMDRDWRFTYVNREAERMLNLSAGELIDRNLWDAYPDLQGTVIERFFRQAVEEDVAVSFENFYAPHGRWYEAKAYPSPDGLSVHFRDVTDRRQAEEERRSLATVVEASTDLVGLASLDGRIRFFNEAGLAMLGLRDNEEARTTTLFDYIFPEDRPLVEREMLPRLAAEGRWEGEWRYRRRDGSAVPISKKVTVIRDPATGEPTAYATVSRDISDRKRAEEDLRRSEEFLRAIVEATPECVKLVAADGSLLHMNAAGLRMIEADDLDSVAGDCVYNLIVPEHRAAWVAFNERVCDGAREMFEFDVLGRRGTRRNMETTAVPVRMPDGSAAHLAVSRDVTERKRHEEELADTRRRLEAALEAGEIGTWVWDIPNDLVRADRNLARMFALPPEEGAAGRMAAFTRMIHPEDAGRVTDAIQRAVDTGGRFEEEYRVVRTGDTVRWLIARGKCERDATGLPVRLSGVAVDITDRRMAEQLLADQKGIFEQMVAGTGLPDLLDDICAAVERQSSDGAVATVLLADPARGGLVPAAGGRCPAEYSRSLGVVPVGPSVGSCGTAAYRGEPVIVEDIGTDPLWAEFNHLALAHGLRACWSAPIRSSGGAVLGTFAVYHRAPRRPEPHDLQVLDVLARTAGLAIERRRAEEAAARRSEQLRRLAEVAARINVAHDTASVVGVTAEEVRRLIGAHQSVSSMMSDGDWSEAITAVSLSDRYAAHRGYDAQPDGTGIYSLVCQTNQPMRLTQAELEAHPAWRGFGGDTRHPPLRGWLAAPLVGRDGKNIGLVQLSDKEEGEFTEDDESILVQLAQLASVAIENARLYESLREADRRKNEFLATLAHELRNPLAPIRMGLEVLRMGGDDPDVTAEMLETMEGQVRQMVRLIDDLLDVSRITSGKLQLRRTRVDLRDVVRTAADTVHPMITEARHHLAVSLPDEPLVIDGDPARLSQILSNLLGNAAKYTPEGGSISLSAERQRSDVVVSVRDTGLGIPSAMLEKVFEMFAQIDRTLERSHGGLGIGLHLVKRLVEMHGGSVSVHSEGEGRGSEFVVRLPLVVLRPASTPQPPSNEDPASRRRILVADDNKDAADLLARVLRVLGHEVLVTYDGEQAVQVTDAFQPDICLLDLGMPKLDGYDTARAIRARPQGERVLLVALTGWGAEEDRRRSKEAGFDRHLVKPVEPSELRELLSERSLAKRLP